MKVGPGVGLVLVSGAGVWVADGVGVVARCGAGEGCGSSVHADSAAAIAAASNAMNVALIRSGFVESCGE